MIESTVRAAYAPCGKIEARHVHGVQRLATMYTQVDLWLVSECGHEHPPFGEHGSDDPRTGLGFDPPQRVREALEYLGARVGPGVQEHDLRDYRRPGEPKHVSAESRTRFFDRKFFEGLEVTGLPHIRREFASGERAQARLSAGSTSTGTLSHDTDESQVLGIESEDSTRFTVIEGPEENRRGAHD